MRPAVNRAGKVAKEKNSHALAHVRRTNWFILSTALSQLARGRARVPCIALSVLRKNRYPGPVDSSRERVLLLVKYKQVIRSDCRATVRVPARWSLWPRRNQPMCRARSGEFEIIKGSPRDRPSSNIPTESHTRLDDRRAHGYSLARNRTTAIGKILC
jgi:hypothetical protein